VIVTSACSLISARCGLIRPRTSEARWTSPTAATWIMTMPGARAVPAARALTPQGMAASRAPVVAAPPSPTLRSVWPVPVPVPGDVLPSFLTRHLAAQHHVLIVDLDADAAIISAGVVVQRTLDPTCHVPELLHYRAVMCHSPTAPTVTDPEHRSEHASPPDGDTSVGMRPARGDHRRPQDRPSLPRRVTGPGPAGTGQDASPPIRRDWSND
jgi:hypothetical protein